VTEQAVREIIALIASELEIPEGRLNAGSSIDTTPEWDSVGHLNICLAVQDRFGVVLDMEAISQLTSVAALAGLVEKA
jgi:acyl carrier protein